MNTIEEFLALVRNELGIPVSADDVDSDLTGVLGWDSIHLLSLVTILERHAGCSVSVIDLLEARDLASIYAVAARRQSSAGSPGTRKHDSRSAARD